jgi:hypothetical protein
LPNDLHLSDRYAFGLQLAGLAFPDYVAGQTGVTEGLKVVIT